MPFVLLVIGFILLLFAAFNVPNGGRVTWGWLGLAFWCAAVILIMHPIP